MFRASSFLLLATTLIIVTSSPIASPSARADDVTDGATRFLQKLADQAVSELTGDDISESHRQDKFREIFHDFFDVPAIGKWVLGRHWRKASIIQRQTYLAEFENFVVNTYAKRFREYSNEQFKVVDARRRNEDAIVTAHLERGESTPPVVIDWKVNVTKGQFKIVDIVVEGVSMAQTQRAEFGSVIRRNGGDVAGLITALKAKNRELQASAAR